MEFRKLEVVEFRKLEVAEFRKLEVAEFRKLEVAEFRKLDVWKTWTSGRPGCPGIWMSGDLDVRNMNVRNLDVLLMFIFGKVFLKG